ncbi:MULTISPECIES: hypothetical protein [Sphingomonadales]|uniref:Flagellar FliJ protein n=2 Tax=Edaphosphingomonas TaxID=3423724 RepID=A0A2T4HPI4_9SPHN|nr:MULTISPECIES: hypothetical protein [Sphingomonas]AGH49076.1 hypothetical protein G432_06755 [Sphingomonas sp. MM-1]OHT21497.1 hypothetical protein BHE75_03505 [Sphingomonas haloaromaticamans]PTD17697.1 hypothetical protein CV103_17065 [Sphingomonas fennica]
MKTPYDGAMRVQQREIDDVRVAISVQVSQLVQIENNRAEVEAAMEREARIAAGDILFSSHAYVERMCAQRARLREDQAVVDAQLGRLRNKAMAAYSSFKAIESAADSFRTEAERARENAEQAQLDDRSATAFALGRGPVRRRSP